MSNTAATNYGPKTKYLMLLFMCLYVFLTNGFAVTSMNMLLGTVTKDLGWTAAEQGLVATAFPTGMIWTVLIGGIVADRLNIKRLMTGLLVLLALVVGLRAFVAGGNTILYHDVPVWRIYGFFHSHRQQGGSHVV